jgi:hypothetical protein
LKRIKEMVYTSTYHRICTTLAKVGRAIEPWRKDSKVIFNIEQRDYMQAQKATRSRIKKWQMRARSKLSKWLTPLETLTRIAGSDITIGYMGGCRDRWKPEGRHIFSRLLFFAFALIRAALLQIKRIATVFRWLDDVPTSCRFLSLRRRLLALFAGYTESNQDDDYNDSYHRDSCNISTGDAR